MVEIVGDPYPLTARLRCYEMVDAGVMRVINTLRDWKAIKSVYC